MPIKLDGEKILVTKGEKSYELERVKSYGYRDLSQETTQPPTITPITSVEDITPEILTYTHSGGSETQTSYTLTFTEDTICDILILGGGGGGAYDRSGGGGAGGCLFYKSFNMNANETYSIKVGKGGTGGISSSKNGVNGGASEIIDTMGTILKIEGGGGAGTVNQAGLDGGCGGGAGSQGGRLGGTVIKPIIDRTQTTIEPNVEETNFIYYGNIGGRDTFPWDGTNLAELDGSGGGGIGEGGTTTGSINAVDQQQFDGGKGGDGLYKAILNGVDYNFKDYFGINGIQEADGYYYIGGGGGGGDHSTGVPGNGGKGGGGTGGNDAVGLNATGYGSGGGGGGGTAKNGGAGSSGIVIIKKYKTPQTIYENVSRFPQTYATSSALYNNDAKLAQWTDGSYTVNAKASEVLNGTTPVWYMFNNVVVSYIDTFHTTQRYASNTTGNYTGTTTFKGVGGIYIVVDLGRPIYAFNLNIAPRDNSDYPNIDFTKNAPGLFKVYASNDPNAYNDNNHSSWTLILDQTTKKTYTNQTFTTFDLNYTNQYQYFAIVTTHIVGPSITNYGYLMFGELYFNGAESLNPNYKTLTFTHQLQRYPPSTHLKDDTTDPASTITTYTHNVSGASYGNGDYIITASSVDGYTFLCVDKIFSDKTDSYLNRVSFANYNYHNPNDNEIDTYSLGGYDGDWIKVQFPESKVLQKLIIYIHSDLTDRAPAVFKIFGSNNGSSWTEIHHQATQLSTSSYLSLSGSGLDYPFSSTHEAIIKYFEVNISNNTAYLHYAIVVNKITGDDSRLDILFLDFLMLQEYTLTFDNPTECDILIVGGGGAAGTGIGGGGGAGGVVYVQNYKLNANTNYKIKVGNGGINTGITYQSYSIKGVNGIDSGIFNNDDTNIIYTDNGANFPLIGYGGGGGGSYTGNSDTEIEPASGGSSGGMGCRNTYDRTMSASVQATQGNTYWNGMTFVPGGYLGGSIGKNGYASAGGGGAGGAGQSPPDGANGGDGGAGIVNDITGTPQGYAGGGGGSTNSSTSTNMGRGGSVVINGTTIYLGGDGIPYGTSANQPGGDGMPNTGSGGGGGGWSDPAELPGNGGSGIVIIRYRAYGIKYDAQWKHHKKLPNIHFYGNVGIGTYANHNKLYVNGSVNVTGDYYKNNRTLTEWINGSDYNIYKNYGNVGIGSAEPNYKLHVEGQIYAAKGGTSGTGNTAWTSTSDMRVKDNITKASYIKCYNNINNIELYRFNYKPILNNTRDINQLGFIAQEVEEIFPKSVKRNKMILNNQEHEVLALDITQINYTLFGAVKYLAEKVEALKQKINNIN